MIETVCPSHFAILNTDSASYPNVRQVPFRTDAMSKNQKGQGKLHKTTFRWFVFRQFIGIINHRKFRLSKKSDDDASAFSNFVHPADQPGRLDQPQAAAIFAT